MRRTVVPVVPVVAAAAIAVLAAVVLMRSDRAPATARVAEPPGAVPVVASARADTAPRPADDVAVDPSVLDTPQARAHLERIDFEQRARRFFDDPAAFAAADRAREAQVLTDAIDRYERARQLSAGEAVALRIGIVRATTDDEVERADRIAAILAHYRVDAMQREARWLEQQNNDPAFAEYKAREAAIVADVMAMATIPDGLTREEYLRRRLEAERVALSQ